MCKEQNELCCPIPCTEGSTEPKPLTPPTSVNPKGTVAAAPLAECVLQLSSRGVRGENMLKADMNTEVVWKREIEKNVLCPVTAVQSCTAVVPQCLPGWVTGNLTLGTGYAEEEP